MRKLYPTEKQVLARLIFPESYDVLLEETGLATGTLRDDLINLVNYRLIEVIDPEDHSNSVSFYDSDNMQDLSFRATKKGLKQIRETV
jgi:hypothetical protein